MMARYAVVSPAGDITNIVVADAVAAAERADWIEATEDAEIGGAWDGQGFVRAPVPDPGPPPVPSRVPALGLINAMAAAGWITDAEADAWVIARSALPAIVQGVVDGLPVDERPAARRRVLAMTVAERADPLVAAVARAAGADDAAVDALFRDAAG